MLNNSGTGSVIINKYTKSRRVVFANVHGVNAPSLVDFQVLSVTECGVGKMCAVI